MYDVNTKLSEANEIIKNEHKILYKLIMKDSYTNRLKDTSEWYETDYFRNYIIEVYLSDYEVEEKVGELSFTEIDINSIDFHGRDRLDMFDAISQEKYELGYFLENSSKLKDFYEECSSIIYIDEILFNKTIRGNGIAHNVLNEITDVIEWFLNYTPDFIVLNSCPFEYADENRHLEESDEQDLVNKYNKGMLELRRKLNKLYLNCAFNEDKCNYFEHTYFYKKFN